MDSKIKAVVKIYGNEYTLVGTESEEYMHKIALVVDQKMREIGGSNLNLSTAMVSVLASVNICEELYKTKDLLDRLTVLAKNNEIDISKLSEKSSSLEKENAYLKDEIQRLKIELARKTGN